MYISGDSVFSIQDTKFRPAQIICQQRCPIPFSSVHSAELHQHLKTLSLGSALLPGLQGAHFLLLQLLFKLADCLGTEISPFFLMLILMSVLNFSSPSVVPPAQFTFSPELSPSTAGLQEGTCVPWVSARFLEL